MTLDQLGSFIKDVGFPAFIALYMLMALGPKMDKLTRAVNRMVDHLGTPTTEVRK